MPPKLIRMVKTADRYDPYCVNRSNPSPSGDVPYNFTRGGRSVFHQIIISGGCLSMSGKYQPLLILFILVLLTGCAGHPPGESPTALIDNVPFYPDRSYRCGPASMAGVLNYWDVKVTKERIARQIYSSNARGTLTVDMIHYAREQGLVTNELPPNVNAIKQSVRDGTPVILLLDSSGPFTEQNHFVVVVGYSDGYAIINSGETERKWIGWKRLRFRWKQVDNWGITVSPPSRPGIEGQVN